MKLFEVQAGQLELLMNDVCREIFGDNKNFPRMGKWKDRPILSAVRALNGRSRNEGRDLIYDIQIIRWDAIKSNRGGTVFLSEFRRLVYDGFPWDERLQSDVERVLRQKHEISSSQETVVLNSNLVSFIDKLFSSISTLYRLAEFLSDSERVLASGKVEQEETVEFKIQIIRSLFRKLKFVPFD